MASDFFRKSLKKWTAPEESTIQYNSVQLIDPNYTYTIQQKMALGGLFGGSTSTTPVTSSTVSSNSQVKDQLKAQIGQELAIANATELVNKITDNCFQQCQKQPFATGEEVCLFSFNYKDD